MISLRTLGPLEIKVDGGEPPKQLTWKKHQALVVYMVFASRHTRSKEHVIGTLWPDVKDPKHSLIAVRSDLTRYGGVTIAEVRDQLQLDPSTVEVDTVRFEDLRRERRWREAAAMIGGEFLEGFQVSETSGFEEWLGTQREQWRARCGEVLTREAERLSKGGSPELAEPLAARACQWLVHSDAAIQGYLTALALQGRRTEALEAGQAFVLQLGKDLPGTNPEPETVELIKAIEKVKVPSHATSRSRPRPPLIGRSDQLEQVLGVWETCRRGEPCAVLVLGDEGMGKSRFADEVMDRARLNNATVAIARGVPGDTSHQWIGLDTLIEGGLLGAGGIAGAPPAAVATLGARSLRWAEAFPIRFSGEPLPLLQAMTEVIRAAAVEHPVLLVADDAQWMDGESLNALIGLVRSLDKCRVMVLVTASSDPPRSEIDQLRSRIGRGLRGVAVTLAPLTQVDLAAMAKWALPAYDDDQVDRIARRMSAESGGYPLIAYVIYTAIADGMEIGEITQPWPRRKNTYHDELPVDPHDHLVGAINVRLGRLTPDAQTLLRVLAVLDGPCAAKRLARGANLPGSSVERALDELEARQWVVADSRGYSFLAGTIRNIVKKTHVLPGVVERILERMSGT